MSNALDPSRILETGFGFWSSKVLLTAIELEVFTQLDNKSMSGVTLGDILGLHPRAIWDFFDTLVALKFLDRQGTGKQALYKNTISTDFFLNKNKPSYIGGILEMSNRRSYKYWDDLETALKTGQPQNEIKHIQRSLFDVLYENPPQLEQFMNAMRSASMANFQAFTKKFDFNGYQTLCDVGGATGLLSCLVTKQHPHMLCTTFDLPVIEPIARKWIGKEQLTDSVRVLSGDFFKQSLPEADIITMGMVLHDWNLEKKKHLIRLAYDALPDNGVFIAIENLIDNDRRENAFGLMMSLNMLIELGDAFDFTDEDFRSWCQEAGFRRFQVLHLAGPCSAAIAYK